MTIVVIFTSISVFKTFRGALTFLPNMVAGLFDILVSSGRLFDFLMSSELKKPVNLFKEKDELDVDIKNGEFFYLEKEKDKKDDKKKKKRNKREKKSKSKKRKKNEKKSKEKADV